MKKNLSSLSNALPSPWVESRLLAPHVLDSGLVSFLVGLLGSSLVSWDPGLFYQGPALDSGFLRPSCSESGVNGGGVRLASVHLSNKTRLELTEEQKLPWRETLNNAMEYMWTGNHGDTRPWPFGVIVIPLSFTFGRRALREWAA